MCAFCARGTEWFFFSRWFQKSLFWYFIKKLRIRLEILFEWIGAFGSLCIQCSKIIVTIVIYYRCVCSVERKKEKKKLFISNVITNVFIMEKYTFCVAFSSMFVEQLIKFITHQITDYCLWKENYINADVCVWDLCACVRVYFSFLLSKRQ